MARPPRLGCQLTRSAGERRGLGAALGQRAQGRERVEELAEPCGPAAAGLARGQHLGGHGRNRGGGHRRHLHGAVDDRGGAAPRLLAPDLHADGPGAAVGVGRPEHGEPRGEPVAARRGEAGGDAAHPGEHADEQQRIRQRGAVAVAPADGIGEPAQLTPGAGGPALATRRRASRRPRRRGHGGAGGRMQVRRSRPGRRAPR